MDRFVQVLLAALEEERSRSVETLASGAVANIEDYRQIVGGINSLDRAREIILSCKKRFLTEEE